MRDGWLKAGMVAVFAALAVGCGGGGGEEEVPDGPGVFRDSWKSGLGVIEFLPDGKLGVVSLKPVVCGGSADADEVAYSGSWRRVKSGTAKVELTAPAQDDGGRCEVRFEHKGDGGAREYLLLSGAKVDGPGRNFYRMLPR